LWELIEKNEKTHYADPVNLNRKKLSIVALDDRNQDLEFWAAKDPLERLEAMEMQRRIAYGPSNTSKRLQRIFEVIDRT